MRFSCEHNCDHCRLCCQGWDIDLSKEDIRTIVSFGYSPKYFLEFKPVLKMKTKGKDRDCIFLDRDDLCKLEKRHGHEAKPHACKQFPRMSTETIKEKDYFFYEYRGRTFTRDLLVTMLDKIRAANGSKVFDAFLSELEKLPRHKHRYVDTFNYEEKKKASLFGRSAARGKARGIFAAKFRQEDINEIMQLKKAKIFDVAKFVDLVKERIPGTDALNPNLPEMLLTYLFALKQMEPRDAKAAADYFFQWNAKRF